MLVALFALIAVALAQSCPAGTCPSSETCCNIGGGQWGCCPYPNADCCTDHAHCCPNGYQCDLSKGQCVKQASASFHAHNNKPATRDLVNVIGAQAKAPEACPAGTCPSTETCCDIGGGQFGCCPYPNADCCTDHAHCCPSGYQCDISKGQCIKQAASGRWGQRKSKVVLAKINRA